MAEQKKRPDKKPKRLKMLSAFAVLFMIIAAMAALTWVVPSGEYEYTTNDAGEEVRVAGSYHEVDKVITKTNTEVDSETGELIITKEVEKDHRQGLWDVVMSPIKGMAERLDVIVFVLILGGFLGVVMKSGALDAALGGLLKRMNGKEKWLIPILMTLFAIGGTTYGMQEETVAFYALIIPIMLAAGFNTMTALMTIVLGSGVGVLASTVNPFSTGIAADAAGVDLGGLLWIQGIILVIALAAAIFFTMRYAAKVKAGKYTEDAAVGATFKTLELDKVPENTTKRKLITTIFAVTFVVMIISLIPWADFGVTVFENFHAWLVGLPVLSTILGAGHNVELGAWYFNEISALFLLSAFIIGFIARKEFKEAGTSLTDVFIKGSGEILGVAIVIAVAAAIGVIMKEGAIQDTIIHWGEEGLKNANGGFVGLLAYLFYLPMSLLVPSTSGLASASMPILAPVADLVGSSKDTMVIAFANAEGLINMIAPTVASLMAGLALSGVSYKNWIKRTAPIMAVFAVISMVACFIMGAI